MARSDAQGLFWVDEIKVKKAKKEKITRSPPARFWVSPDYLPGLQDAIDWVPDLYNDMELYQASKRHETLLFDSEIYPNYCLFMFKSEQTGKVIYFELDDHGPMYESCDLAKMQWVLQNFLIVNFNGLHFDFPLAAIALYGYDSQALWNATCQIIVEEKQPYQVLKSFKVKKLETSPGLPGEPWIDQIDLIALTALAPGLKVCAGRLHAKRMQDLPFEPGTWLTPSQILITRRYCCNDLDNTGLLYESVKPQINIRIASGIKYKLDLRSRSDAQMAEDIVGAEIKRITGLSYVKKPKMDATKRFHFKTPAYIKFYSPLMQWLLQVIESSTFTIDPVTGAVVLPTALEDQVIEINRGKYKFGIGGLHSQEKSIAHVADADYFIADTDATSYYPFIILNAGLFPENLGKDFLVVFDGIVVDRVTAKKGKDIITAECLKIVVNGTFGKLGSRWSIVYAPELLIQTTLTGQLSIAMLIERFELNEIEVISVNTDGIVVKCLRTREHVFNEIVAQWRKESGLDTEETRYKAVYSKDINNYIAVYEEPQKGEKFKTKGLYSKTNPKKNAVNEVCIDALKAFIADGISPAETIAQCDNIAKFTSMRFVDGGAVKVTESTFDPKAGMETMTTLAQEKGFTYDAEEKGWRHPDDDPFDAVMTLGEVYARICVVTNGVYLGKVIRWYYSTEVQGEIISAKSGNKVARTDGARPCMDLPDEMPKDLNREWYVEETYRILKKIGYTDSHPQLTLA